MRQSLHHLQHRCDFILFVFIVFLGLYDLIQDGLVASEHVGEQIRFLAIHCLHSVSVGTKSHSVSSWHKSGKHDLHAPQAKSSLHDQRELHG
jgi:hypothetical protein